METKLDPMHALFREGNLSFVRGDVDSASRSSDAERPMVLLDKHGVVRFCNPSMELLFNCRKGELDGCDVAKLLPSLPLRKKTPGYNLAFATFWEQEALQLNLNGHTTTGGSLLLTVSVRRVSVERHHFILLSLFRATQHLGQDRELESLMAAAEVKSDMVVVTDTEGIICYVNAAFERISGYSRNEVLGQPARIMRSGLHDADFYKNLWATVKSGNDFRAVFFNRRKNGEIFNEDKHIRPFMNRQGKATHFVATSRELDEPLRSTLLRLQHEANHDALTGLPNRNLFMDRLGQALFMASRKNAGFAVVFVDLDGFKAINDNHGHAAGDAVLCAAAEHMRNSVRDQDTVARLGGDEFALILLDIQHREDVQTVLGKLLSVFATGTTFEKKHFSINASLGADIYPAGGGDIETLIRHADLAMYGAKAAGGACLHFFKEQDQRDAPLSDKTASRRCSSKTARLMMPRSSSLRSS